MRQDWVGTESGLGGAETGLDRDRIGTGLGLSWDWVVTGSRLGFSTVNWQNCFINMQSYFHREIIFD